VAYHRSYSADLPRIVRGHPLASAGVGGGLTWLLARQRERSTRAGQRWYRLEAMVDRETFDRIKEKHGLHASWAVWSEPDGKPKSNMGYLPVLDPDQNLFRDALVGHVGVTLGGHDG